MNSITMKIIEYAIVVYGMSLISYFVLSMISFMSNPIIVAMGISEGFALISAWVIGFFILIGIYFYSSSKSNKIEAVKN